MYAVARSAALRNAGLLGTRSLVAPVRRDFRVGINTAVADFRSQIRPPRDHGLRTLTSAAEASLQPPPRITSDPLRTPTPPPPRNRPLYIRIPLALTLTLISFTLAFAMTAAPALPTAQELLQPPTDEETLTLFTPPTPEVSAIDAQILNHPFTQSLLADPKYTASRPHLKVPEQLRAQNLTAGLLQGPDRLAVPPLQFTTADGSEYVSFQYVGSALCGHPGIVHGGLLATLLDEGLARCCFPALPNKVAVTASLRIEYKKPVAAGQVVVLRAETTRVEGRKAWVKGWLETLPVGEEEAVVLTEAEALFIEPRQAASMKRVVS